ncbi:hypothetical protein FRC18_005913 [Serendipita sp. 400]|nr:hypothetical protein FRC18_005913 [Serendipita sp. 400]
MWFPFLHLPKMLRTAPRALNRTGNWPKCHNAVPTLRKFATTKAVEENVEQIILQRSLASSCSTILTSRSYSTSFGLRPPDKKPWSASDSRFSHEEASRFTGKGQKDLKPKVPGDINAEDINAEDIKPGDFDSEDINSGYINPGATITKDKLPHLLSENEVVDLPEPSFIPPDATSTLEITNLLPVTLRTDILVWCRTAGLSVLDDRFRK